MVISVNGNKLVETQRTRERGMESGVKREKKVKGGDEGNTSR